MNISQVYIDKILSLRSGYDSLIDKLTKKQDYLAEIKAKATDIYNKLLDIKYSKVNDDVRKKEILLEITKIEKMQKNIENEMKPLLEKFEQISKDAEVLYAIIIDKYPDVPYDVLQLLINEQIESQKKPG